MTVTIDLTDGRSFLFASHGLNFGLISLKFF